MVGVDLDRRLRGGLLHEIGLRGQLGAVVEEKDALRVVGEDDGLFDR